MVVLGIVAVVVLALLVLRSGACDPQVLQDEQYTWDTDEAYPDNVGFKQALANLRRK